MQDYSICIQHGAQHSTRLGRQDCIAVGQWAGCATASTACDLGVLARTSLSPAQVMSLVLAGAKRQMGAAPDQLRVGKPHGAESGFDPHSAYKDLDDSNFFGWVCCAAL